MAATDSRQQIMPVTGYPPFELNKSRFDQSDSKFKTAIMLRSTAEAFLGSFEQQLKGSCSSKLGSCMVVATDRKCTPTVAEECLLAAQLTAAEVLALANIETTFSGRLFHFCNVIDPRTLFTTEAKLKASIDLLDNYKKGTLPPGTTDKQLWKAQHIKQAVIHPDTGEKIFMPFRMSGYVPFGSPIVVGLLLPNPTIKATIFWQWINQSHNACVNFCNRNATKPTSTSRFVAGYTGAVTSAVSIAVGLNVFISKANGFSPATKMLITRFVPFPAVAAANVCNVVLMRNNELSEGIEVFDKQEKLVGTSKIAAKRMAFAVCLDWILLIYFQTNLSGKGMLFIQALTETAITRMFLPAPVLMLPPVIMSMLEKTRFLKHNPRYNLAANAIVCTVVFACALPSAIALFPQYSEINILELEPEFKDLTRESVLVYNKGL